MAGAQWLHGMRDDILQRELSVVASTPAAAKLAERGLVT